MNVCPTSRLLAGISGDIQSPNYPEEYPHNIACALRLTGIKPGRVVVFSIGDIELEKGWLTCADYISFTGRYNKDTRLCDNTMTALTIEPMEGEIQVKFVSDSDSVRKKGFNITYTGEF